MKAKLFLFFLCTCLFTNCLSDNGDDIEQDNTVIKWHLINVTGGISGVDHDFEIDEVTWIFDELNSLVLVQNNNPDGTLEDSLDSGTYTQYVLKDEDDNLFLFINDSEYSLLTFSEDGQNFTLNQNIQSTGTGSDGFVYIFEK